MSLPYAEPDPLSSSKNPKVRAAFTLGRGFFYFIATNITLAVIAFIGFFFGGFFGIGYLTFALLLTFIAAGQARLILHRRRLAAIFHICARAIDARLPLPEFLRAAAASEQGTGLGSTILRRRLHHIARELAAGNSLDLALTHTLPELDERQASLLVASSSTGNLLLTLDRLAAECSPPLEQRPPQRPSTLAYAAWTMSIMGAICFALTIFVFPKFNQIMRDFGLPFKTNLGTLQPVYASISVAGLLLFYCLLFITIVRLFRRRSTGSVPVPLSFARFVPILGDFLPFPARHRALADLYHAIADGLTAGRTLPEILLWASASNSSRALYETQEQRQTLLTQLSSGAALSHAAKAAGIPSADIAFLSAARDHQTLITTFRLLAEQRDRKSSALEHKLAAVGSLVVLAILTALTLPLVHAIWAPMITIVNGLADQILQPRW